MKSGNPKNKFSERELIEQIKGLAGTSNNDVLMGIGDDCAVVRGTSGKVFLVTTDTLVETIHFNLEWHAPYYLGRKAASTNISDIAAMGGRPRFALFSAGIPDPGEPWFSDFIKGFTGVLKEHGVILIGGDTVKVRKDAVFSITIIGEGEEDLIVYRSGAKPGDLIWVSGCIGDAAAGLEIYKRIHEKLPIVEEDKFQQLLLAHTNPEPQVEIGELLAENQIVHSMVDLSDGLATDLAHICTESGIGAEIQADELPLSPLMREAADHLNLSALDLALKGGEDYQLLFTSSPDDRDKVYNLVKDKAGREIFCIGRMSQRSGVYLSHSDGQIIEIGFQGYDHFSEFS